MSEVTVPLIEHWGVVEQASTIGQTAVKKKRTWKIMRIILFLTTRWKTGKAI